MKTDQRIDKADVWTVIDGEYVNRIGVMKIRLDTSTKGTIIKDGRVVHLRDGRWVYYAEGAPEVEGETTMGEEDKTEKECEHKESLNVHVYDEEYYRYYPDVDQWDKSTAFESRHVLGGSCGDCGKNLTTEEFQKATGDRFTIFQEPFFREHGQKDKVLGVHFKVKIANSDVETVSSEIAKFLFNLKSGSNYVAISVEDPRHERGEW